MKGSTVVAATGFAAVAVVSFFMGHKRPGPRRATRPKRAEVQTYSNREQKVAMEKPRTTDWVLADGKEKFHSPTNHPDKVMEMRRVPEDGRGPFALLELFIVDLGESETEAAATQRLERLEGITPWSKEGTFTVLDEGPVTIGGRAMTRRITELAFRGRKCRLFSVRTVCNGKLYMPVALTDAGTFDAVRPEIEQAFASLRIN